MSIKQHQIYTTLFFLLLTLLITRCAGTKDLTITETESSFFLTGNKAQEEASYAHIVNSVDRLRAMMSGVFVHYNSSADPESKKYSTWMVNDGVDSVVIYAIPVGEPNKIGYWLYTYQIMTSLPDEPIFESFSKLTEIDRDSIQCEYYAAPDDFNLSLEDLLKDPENAFETINVNDLAIHEEEDETMYFVKQTATHYLAISSLEKGEEVPGVSVLYRADFEDVKPSRTSFGRQGYDKNKKYVGRRPPEILIKKAMIQADLHAK